LLNTFLINLLTNLLIRIHNYIIMQAFYFKNNPSKLISFLTKEKQKKVNSFLRQIAAACFCFILNINSAKAQAIDYSNCAECSSGDIALFTEVKEKLQGIKGFNPSAPSTYNLIGNRKFSGPGIPILNPFVGENWYPIRTEKQHLTGIVNSFGITHILDEHDWNIHIIPDADFEGLISDAIPYRKDDAHWSVSPEGKFLIEAEITPDSKGFGNPWFNNHREQSSLINKRLSVYGPFVREEAHGNHPEIHPCEQIWWKENENTNIVLLLNDDSNRFDDRADSVVYIGGKATVIKGDYTARRVTTYAYQPWSPNKKQEAELWVAFELNPSLGGLKVDIQAIDNFNFHKDAAYPDVSDADKYSISYKGNVVLTVQESAAIDPFTGISFKNICYNSITKKLHGYIVINTAVGNGNGKEGFVALHIDKREVGLNPKPVIVTGNLANNWQQFSAYDDAVAFSDIISSDMYGKGIVDGMIDFNGNGKTDFFTKKGDLWMVLYDGTGTWQELASSTIDVSELRFGDIDGDGKTDILRVGPSKKVMVSYGGTSTWTIVTDAGAKNNFIQVGDFNGDNKTDIIYVSSYYPTQPAAALIIADIYIKYSCTGSWKNLKSSLYLDNATDYNNFRFGDFNGDGITDIFRNSKGRFGVYWNGTGNFKEIHRPGFTVNTDDLLFANNLTLNNFTDIIYVDRNTKEWSVFYKGSEPSPAMNIKFGDPQKVRFGDINQDPAWELFAIDYIYTRTSPATVNMNTVAATIHEPTILSEYMSGSLTLQSNGSSKSLSMGMSLEYYPGTKSLLRSNMPASNKIEWVKDQSNQQPIAFIPNSSANDADTEPYSLISIPSIPLRASSVNNVQVKFKGQVEPKIFSIPALAIIGEKSNIREAAGAPANWQAWAGYLASTASPARVVLTDAAPATPVQIKDVQFELVPLYTSYEGGKLSLEEMDGAAKDLNVIAYSYDTTKFKTIFSTKNVFNINWQFELKDLTTGAILPTTNLIVTKGRWIKSKVLFTFPETQNLVQLKATATVSDDFANQTIQPTEFILFNQKILLTNSKQQILNWLLPIFNAPTNSGYIWVRDHWERPRSQEDTFSYIQLLNKAQYLAEDAVLTPAELNEIIKLKLHK
jgi:FG-GAP-like repeat